MRRLGWIAVVLLALCGAAAPGIAGAADWRPTFELEGPSESLDDADVAVGRNGDAVLVFSRDDGESTLAVFARWSVGGGAFSDAVRISEAGEEAYNPRVAVGADGAATAVFQTGDAANAVLKAATKPAGAAGFGAPDTLSDPGASEQQVAVDDVGGAVVVWNQASSAVLASYRDPGDSFTDGDEISGGGSFGDPSVAMDAAGDAVAVWREDDGSDIRAATALRPAGGTFGPGSYRSDSGDDADLPDVAMNARGDALVSWTLYQGTDTIQAATRPAGGAFGDPLDVSEPPDHAYSQRGALDDAGNAIVAFIQDTGGESRARYATGGVGRAFSDPQDASPAGADAGNPTVATGAAGQAI
ncbi:MAG TPA: hypothetical protein VF587_17745, partial [Solirubrobacteraceae bacterium]